MHHNQKNQHWKRTTVVVDDERGQEERRYEASASSSSSSLPSLRMGLGVNLIRELHDPALPLLFLLLLLLERGVEEVLHRAGVAAVSASNGVQRRGPGAAT